MGGNHQHTQGNTLIELVKRSDADAFSSLFRSYSSRIYRFSFGYLKSKEEAEEIVQETFLRIWQTRATLDASYSFEGFLFTIARNLVLKRIRKARNRARCEDAVRINSGGGYFVRRS